MSEPVEIKETEVLVRGKLIERADDTGGSYVRFEVTEHGEQTHMDVSGLRPEDVRRDQA